MSVFEWLWLFLVVGQCFSSWGHQAYWVLTGSRRGLLSYMKLKYKKRNRKATDIHLHGIRLRRLITYQSLTFWSISSFLTWVPGLTLSFDPQNSGDRINQIMNWWSGYVNARCLIFGLIAFSSNKELLSFTGCLSLSFLWKPTLRSHEDMGNILCSFGMRLKS